MIVCTSQYLSTGKSLLSVAILCFALHECFCHPNSGHACLTPHPCMVSSRPCASGCGPQPHHCRLIGRSSSSSISGEGRTETSLARSSRCRRRGSQCSSLHSTRRGPSGRMANTSVDCHARGDGPTFTGNQSNGLANKLTSTKSLVCAQRGARHGERDVACVWVHAARRGKMTG